MAPFGARDTPEQPDTTAIRAEVEQWGEALAGDWVWALCDALDAARAERDDIQTGARQWADWAMQHEARAEAAEARIAAVREAVQDNWRHATEDVGMIPVAVVERALTKGTGQ